MTVHHEEHEEHEEHEAHEAHEADRGVQSTFRDTSLECKD